jgi:hypothetical protein
MTDIHHNSINKLLFISFGSQLFLFQIFPKLYNLELMSLTIDDGSFDLSYSALFLGQLLLFYLYYVTGFGWLCVSFLLCSYFASFLWVFFFLNFFLLFLIFPPLFLFLITFLLQFYLLKLIQPSFFHQLNNILKLLQPFRIRHKQIPPFLNISLIQRMCLQM